MAPRTIGQRVRELRTAKGISVNELNRLVFIDGKELSSGYISELENDKKTEISLPHISAIAEALGTTIDYLANGKGPKRFVSGEVPAVYGPGQKVKPNLELTLEQMNARERWTKPTIAGARAVEEDKAAADWPRWLDQLDAAMRSLQEVSSNPALAPPSGKHLLGPGPAASDSVPPPRGPNK